MNKLKIILDSVNRISRLDARKNTRKREYVFLRMIYYKIAYSLLNPEYSLEKIGAEVGRNHATVIHALKTFDVDILKNKEYKYIYSKCYSLVSDLLNRQNSEVRREMLIHSLIELKDENVRLRAKLSENIKPESDYFMNDLKSLTPNQYRIFKQRAEVMMKSVRMTA